MWRWDIVRFHYLESVFFAVAFPILILILHFSRFNSNFLNLFQAAFELHERRGAQSMNFVFLVGLYYILQLVINFNSFHTLLILCVFVSVLVPIRNNNNNKAYSIERNAKNNFKKVEKIHYCI